VFTPQLPDLHLSVRAVVGGGSDHIAPPTEHTPQRIKRLQTKGIAMLPPLPNIAGNILSQALTANTEQVAGMQWHIITKPVST
jgi:hypothetical protein